MKNLILAAFAMLLTSLAFAGDTFCKHSGQQEKVIVNPDIRIRLNSDITSSDGCRWHVSGHIDLGFSGVSGYDVTISGDCGTHHFVGLISLPTPEDDKYTAADGEVEAYLKLIIDKNLKK